MSARMLQRALRARQTTVPASKIESDEEEEEETQHAGAGNIFDLLGPQDDAEATSEREEEDAVEAIAKTVSSSNMQQKSKKKKNKKKEKVFAVQDETEVEQILDKLTIDNPVTPHVNEEKKKIILAADPKYLSAQDELRRIFGSKVINSMAPKKRHQGGKKFRTSRKTILSVPFDHWPRYDGGLTMDHLETKDGFLYFRYVHTASYKQVQQSYEACVASHDPHLIATLLAHHPYHVESLLAMVELYRHTGDHQQSAVHLEMAMYALECAWHPWFNPTAGNCRLPYSCEENKPFFVALFRHVQNLGRRGCHRTALEVCKLLLSLDPDDPFGATFCIDYYAIRAEQYQWLECFVKDCDKYDAFAHLPNFSFSLAIARFYIEQKESSSETESVSSLDMLQQALMLHPLVLGRIVSKAPVKEDAEWRKLLKHPHFAKATYGGPSLEHLIDIYIERNHLLWRSPELQSWLKSAATAVVETAKGDVSDWACARALAFPSEDNEYRHLRVSEFSDSITTLPPEELQHFVRGGDGAAAGAAAAAAPAPGTGEDVNLEGRNALILFLESLLPWTDYGVESHSRDVDDDNADAD